MLLLLLLLLLLLVMVLYQCGMSWMRRLVPLLGLLRPRRQLQSARARRWLLLGQRILRTRGMCARLLLLVLLLLPLLCQRQIRRRCCMEGRTVRLGGYP
jgi:hypothetical protein